MNDIEKRARELLADTLSGQGWAGEFAALALQSDPGNVRISGADAIAVLVTALTPPEGFVLVPVEPTEAMIRAYREVDGRFESARADWAAMLTARPEVK